MSNLKRRLLYTWCFVGFSVALVFLILSLYFLDTPKSEPGHSYRVLPLYRTVGGSQ